MEDETPANTKMQESVMRTWLTSFIKLKIIDCDQDGEMFILGLLKEQRQEQAHKERISQVESERWEK